MSSRARIFAAVTLLVGCLAGPAAWAQAQNLEAGKSASQLFAGTCNACHKSPRGLLKTVSPGSLSGFLREHYTTGGDMASQLAAYLISNGASDSRQSKQGADKQGAGNDQADRPGRKNRNSPSEEAARPDDTPPPGEGGRQSRKRLAPPGEQPEEGRPVANAPAQADVERGPDGRKLSAKQRSKLGKQPGAEEPSMANEPPKSEPAKTESGTDDKAKAEPSQEMGNTVAKPDAQGKSADEVKSQPVKSEAAKIEAPKDSASGMVRRDPVPTVTAAPAPASTAEPAPAVASGGSPEQAAPRPQAPAAPQPSATTASAPPPPPADGPPSPPISR
ncbi:MAG: hypothetical protein ABSG88_15755 [Bradyrhizobium sp.]